MSIDVEVWRAQARELGRDHGKAAASWVIDGNTDHEHIARMVRMFDEGDPALEQYLPGYPNLSGEWADELTPDRLFEQVTGLDAHAEATFNQDAYQTVLEELCGAYEDGVSETFQTECERILRAALPTACPDCGEPISLQPSGWWTHDGMPGDCWRQSMDGPNV